MGRSGKFLLAPLFGACLAAIAGCSNPAAEQAGPLVTGGSAAGSGSVLARAAGNPAPSSAGAGPSTVTAGSGPVVAAAAGGGGVAARAEAGSGGAGALAGAAAGAGASGAGASGAASSGGVGGSSAVAGAGGSAVPIDPDDLGSWFPDLDGSNSMTPPPAVDSCQDLFCFDLPDCASFHPDEAATCKFTACENFVCK